MKNYAKQHDYQKVNIIGKKCTDSKGIPESVV